MERPERLRVLHLVATLGCGGAEKQLFLLCRHTSDAVRHRVLALAGGGVWRASLLKAEVAVECLEAGSLRNPALVVRIRKAVGAAAPDVVHCWLPSVNILGAIACRWFGNLDCRLIASVRNVDDWKPLAYRCLERVAAPSWDAVMCNSVAGAQLTARSGVPWERIHLVPNGIEARPAASLAERLQARREFGLPEGAFVVSTVSRLAPPKRVDLFLRVAAELAGRIPSSRFLIAGDGRLKAELEAQARRPELEQRVRFLGQVRDARPVLAASDVFLLCSEREGMSNVLLEAMQTGCVPLVTDVGDNRRIIEDGWNGRILRPDQMTEEAVRLASHPVSLERLRRRAPRAAERFSAEEMARRTVAVYMHLAGQQSMEPHICLKQPRAKRRESYIWTTPTRSA